MSSPESPIPQVAAPEAPPMQAEVPMGAAPDSAPVKDSPKEVPGTVRYWDGPGGEDLVEVRTGDLTFPSADDGYAAAFNGDVVRGTDHSMDKISGNKRVAGIGSAALGAYAPVSDGGQEERQADAPAPLTVTHATASDTSTSPATPLQTLDRYDYTGPLSEGTAFRDSVNDYLNTSRPPMPEVAETTESYEAQLEAVNDSILELGRDLGLDLRNRTRGTDYVHLYPRHEYHKVNAALRRPEGSVGTLSASGHLFAAESSTQTNTLGNASHEGVHRAQRRSFRLAIGEHGLNISEGTHHHAYTNERTGAFDGVTETVSEMTNIELIRNYWGNHAELPANAEAEYTEVGYIPGLLLFDRLIARMPNPRETYKAFQTGTFTGDMKNLKVFLPVLGQAGVKRLAQLDPYSAASARAIAEDLGDTDLVQRLSELKEGDTIDTRTLMSWL